MEYIRDAIERITEDIRTCAQAAGRNPEDITLMAVSKTQPIEKIIYARENCDMHCFGENRVQELSEKFQEYRITDELHMIGHLQSNKVKKVVEQVSWIDSVDSIKILERIDRALHGSDRIMNVLFEFNTSGESAKSGFETVQDLYDAIEAGLKMKHIEMRGLMTIGPLGGDDDEIRSAFSRLRNLYFDSIKMYPEIQFDTISMGMSSDYRIAIEEGSTMIRVGTAIFGKRNYA